MIGTSSSAHFLRSHVGMGSRLQDVEGDFIIISRTESSDRVAKLENVVVEEVDNNMPFTMASAMW